MKKVLTVNSNEVCKMKNKTNYEILDENLIYNYIRKYVTNIVFQEDNVIKRINEDYNKNKFYVELLYDDSSLNLYEIMFDDDLMGFDFINTDKNHIIFFNYKESNLKLRFELLCPLVYHTSKYNYKNYVCLHQLNGSNSICKLSNHCTKYNNLLNK